MINVRQIATLCIFVVIGLAIILMYPSELFWRNIDALPDRAEILKIMYFMNWAGIYHHYEVSSDIRVLLRDSWGYLVILFIMFIERYLQEKLYAKLQREEIEIEEDIANDTRSKRIATTRDEIREYIEAKSGALIYQSVRIYL